MGKLAFLLLLAGIAQPAQAGQRVTVEQLEQLLIAALGKPDAKVAKQLSGLELSERASSARLSQWEAEFNGSRHTCEALLALADASAFLDLPAAEIPDLTTPDLDTQRLMLSRVIDYASKTVSALPNFAATRQTTHFINAAHEQVSGQLQPYGSRVITNIAPLPDSSFSAHSQYPLHIVSRSSVEVTYRDGQEVLDTRAGKDRKSEAMEIGLTTSGEFGPILDVVIKDAARRRMSWSHWEKGAAGPEAVFRYSVPQELSHYEVALTNELLPMPQFQAYHGEIAVDPENGEILRVVMVADLKPANPMVEANILVEYGPVDIGGRIYICPIKGVALFRAPGPDGGESQHASVPLRTEMNDISFTHYHVFRAEMRILTDDNAKP
jgi:hypothetical protein